MSYDGLFRLTSVTEGEATISFAYDPLGRLAARSTQGSTLTFRYDGTTASQVQELSGGSLLSSYTLAPDGTPLAQEKEGELSYMGISPHRDISFTLNSGGNLSGSRIYDPYGNPLADTLDSDLGYQGDYTDPGAGLVWMGARWYSPSLTRFLSVDPLAGKTDDPLTSNPYLYCSDDPVNSFDPTGASSWLIPYGLDELDVAKGAVGRGYGGHGGGSLEEQIAACQGRINYLKGNLNHLSPQRDYWIWLGLPASSGYFGKLAGTCQNITNRLSYERRLLARLWEEKRRRDIERALMEKQMAAQQAAKAAEDSGGKVTPEDLAKKYTPEYLALLMTIVGAFAFSPLPSEARPEVMVNIMFQVVKDEYGLEELTWPDLFEIGNSEYALSALEDRFGPVDEELAALTESGVGRVEAIRQLCSEKDPFRDMSIKEITKFIHQAARLGVPDGYIEDLLVIHTDNSNLRDDMMLYFFKAKAGAYDASWTDYISLNLTVNFGFVEFNINISKQGWDSDVAWCVSIPGASATVSYDPHPEKKIVRPRP